MYVGVGFIELVNFALPKLHVLFLVKNREFNFIQKSNKACVMLTLVRKNEKALFLTLFFNHTFCTLSRSLRVGLGSRENRTTVCHPLSLGSACCAWMTYGCLVLFFSGSSSKTSRESKVRIRVNFQIKWKSKNKKKLHSIINKNIDWSIKIHLQ